MVDLTALQSAVEQLKTEVAAITPGSASSGNDQAAVDQLTTEVEQLVTELSSSSSSPAAVTAPGAGPGTADAPASGTAAWTPPGS